MRRYEIKADDYERYRIHLPWSVVLHGKAGNYINSELEKKHPCFSNEWSFDKKSKIGKKGVDSDVVVINKFVLADYRQRFPGKKFSLENLSRSGKWFRRSRKKNVKLLSMIAVFCVISLYFLIFDSYAEKQKEDAEVNTEKEESIVEITVRTGAVQSFLDLLEKNNGRLDYLEWTSDGYMEVFIAKVNLLYPEQLENKNFSRFMTISNVEYENEKPSFTVTLKDRCAGAGSNAASVEQNGCLFVPERKKLNKAEVRQVFRDFGIQLTEEMILQTGFKFCCNQYKEIENENFLNGLISVVTKNQTGISKILLRRVANKNDTDGFSGEVYFDERMNVLQGINLEPLAWRTNLIFDREKRLSEVTAVTKKSEIVTDKAEKSNSGRKTEEKVFGEILRSDGSRVRFMKNSQGKIVKEEVLK